MKYSAKIITTLIIFLTMQPLSALAASTKQELAELQGEVAALKDGQKAIQADLAEIKKLLQEGARAPAAAAPSFQPKVVTMDGAPFLGDADATVTLMEFSDYQCPFCSRHYRDVMPTLVEEYVNTGKLKYVMRENPIQSIHSRALPAAKAALCAQDQGKYWEMHNMLFDNQKELTDENLKAFAETIGLDTVAFDTCTENENTMKRIDEDLVTGSSIGIRGTPGFVVGLTDPDDSNQANMTQFINGAQSLANFQAAINALLESAE
ncbi:DsbA family protein [Pseudomonadota bacterium]